MDRFNGEGARSFSLLIGVTGPSHSSPTSVSKVRGSVARMSVILAACIVRASAEAHCPLATVPPQLGAVLQPLPKRVYSLLPSGTQ